MNNNEIERIMASETTKMIEDIMQGKKVETPKDPVIADRSEREVLKDVENVYKNIISPPKQENT